MDSTGLTLSLRSHGGKGKGAMRQRGKAQGPGSRLAFLSAMVL